MDIFSRNKLLVQLIILLVVINIAAISFSVVQSYKREGYPRPPHPDQEQNHAVLTKELNLNPHQEEQLDQVRNEFFKKEELLSQVLREQRDSMNDAMFNQTTDTVLVKQIARRVAGNEYRMELLRFEQAKQLKAICTPEQLKKFDRLVREIRDYFRPHHGPERKE